MHASHGKGAEVQGLPHTDRLPRHLCRGAQLESGDRGLGEQQTIFSRREAELVTEPALTAEPLANPGTVIRKLRGTAAEQIAALGPEEPSPRKGKAAAPAKKVKPPPRRSRAKLEAAEKAVAAAKEKRAAALAKIAERQAELERERREAAQRHDAAVARLEEARADAEAAYQEALRKWRG